MKEEKRKGYIDVAKGIGILAVVIGHTSVPVVADLYYWHLPLFFFIGGLNYNVEKYHLNGRQIGSSLAIFNRLNSFMPTYFEYTTLLILLHNTFSNMGILREDFAALYGKKDMIIRFFRIFILSGELFEGPAWFMIPYIWSLLFFGLIVGFAYHMRISAKWQWVFIVLSCFALGCFSYFLMQIGYVGEMWTDIALLVLPYFALGTLYRKMDAPEIKSPVFKWMLFLLCIVFICISSHVFHVWNTLDRRRFDWGIVGSYLLAFAGIYAVFHIARVIDSHSKLGASSHILKYIGKHSMDIMILHTAFFKLADWVYTCLSAIPPEKTLSCYPYSVTLFWFQPIYWMVGVTGPILVAFLFQRLEKGLKWIMQKTFFDLAEIYSSCA